jgi:hypothetical protein
MQANQDEENKTTHINTTSNSRCQVDNGELRNKCAKKSGALGTLVIDALDK